MVFSLDKKGSFYVTVAEIKLRQSFEFNNTTYVKLGENILVPDRAICMTEGGTICYFYLDSLVKAGPMCLSITFPA